MLQRQTTGSVVCPSCGRLVGVTEAQCYNCGRTNPGMWGYTKVLRALGNDMGLSAIVIGGCTIMFLLSLALHPAGVNLGGLLGFLGPSTEVAFVLGASGAQPVFGYGRWWTVLTASWLHGGALHILFNMMWIRRLAPEVASLYGPGRATLIYVAAGVGGFSLSTVGFFFPGFINFFMGGGTITLGASASLFGLIGALLHYSRRTGRAADEKTLWSWAIGFMVFGFVMDGVDNWAHLGGFLTGWGVAYYLDPLKPERIDHMIAGLICLVLTLVGVLVSLWTGLPYLRAILGGA